MNAEEPTENPVSTAEPQPTGTAGAERHDPRRHRGGRRGRFRRGGRGGGRDGRENRPEREERGEGESRGEKAPPTTAEEGRKPVSSSIRKAIDHVLHVRAELRRVLDEIQEILRTLEQAEREKTASEDEIEMLRDALRGLHREPGFPRQRGGSAARPAPAPVAASQEQAEPPDDGEHEAEEDTEEED